MVNFLSLATGSYTSWLISFPWRLVHTQKLIRNRYPAGRSVSNQLFSAHRCSNWNLPTSSWVLTDLEHRCPRTCVSIWNLPASSSASLILSALLKDKAFPITSIVWYSKCSYQGREMLIRNRLHCFGAGKCWLEPDFLHIVTYFIDIIRISAPPSAE